MPEISLKRLAFLSMISVTALLAGSVYFMTISRIPVDDYGSQVVAIMKHLLKSVKLESGTALCSSFEAVLKEYKTRLNFKKALDNLNVPALEGHPLCGQKYESTAVGEFERLLVSSGFRVGKNLITPMIPEKEFQVTVGCPEVEAVEDGRVIAILGARLGEPLQVFLRTTANKSWIDGLTKQVFHDHIVNSTKKVLIVYQYKRNRRVQFL